MATETAISVYDGHGRALTPKHPPRHLHVHTRTCASPAPSPPRLSLQPSAPARLHSPLLTFSRGTPRSHSMASPLLMTPREEEGPGGGRLSPRPPAYGSAVPPSNRPAPQYSLHQSSLRKERNKDKSVKSQRKTPKVIRCRCLCVIAVKVGRTDKRGLQYDGMGGSSVYMTNSSPVNVHAHL